MTFAAFFWMILFTAGVLALITGLAHTIKEDRGVPPRSHKPDEFSPGARTR